MHTPPSPPTTAKMIQTTDLQAKNIECIDKIRFISDKLTIQSMQNANRTQIVYEKRICLQYGHGCAAYSMCMCVRECVVRRHHKSLIPYNLIINSSILTILDADLHRQQQHCQIKKTKLFFSFRPNIDGDVNIHTISLKFKQIYRCTNASAWTQRGSKKKLLDFVFYNHDKLDEIACWFSTMLYVVTTCADHTVVLFAIPAVKMDEVLHTKNLQTQSEQV